MKSLFVVFLLVLTTDVEVQTAALGEICSESSQCGDNQECTGSIKICICQADFIPESQTCRLPKHKEKCVSRCQTSFVCGDDVGSQTCACSASHYYQSFPSLCRDTTELNVKELSVATRTENSISLRWKIDSSNFEAKYIAKYRMVSRPSAGSTSMRTNAGWLSELTPGTKYSITVETYFPAKDSYTERSTGVPLDAVWTKPSKPGLLDVSRSQFLTPDTVFAFTPSTGQVDKYHIWIASRDGTVTSGEFTTTRLELKGIKLLSDVIYQYQIIAVNGVGDESEPAFDCFTTTSTGERNTTCSKSEECLEHTNSKCLSSVDVFPKYGYTCLCGTDEYCNRISLTCKSTIEMKIQNPQVEHRYTTSIWLKWSEPDEYSARRGLKYRIVSNPPVVGPGSWTISRTGIWAHGAVRNLTPGTTYAITIESYIPATDFYDDEKVIGVTLKTYFWTKPASPEKYDPIRSNLYTPPLTFAWLPSRGQVAIYKITITWIGGEILSTRVVNSKVTGLLLQPDITYSAEIVAVNAVGDESETSYYTFIHHHPSASSKVVELYYDYWGSNVIKSGWRSPASPNGKIHMFVVQIFKDGDCVIAHLLFCTDCGNNQQIPSFSECGSIITRDEFFTAKDVYDQFHTFRVFLKNLKSDTKYSARVFAINEAGNGEPVDFVFTTLESEDDSKIEYIVIYILVGVIIVVVIVIIFYVRRRRLRSKPDPPSQNELSQINANACQARKSNNYTQEHENRVVPPPHHETSRIPADVPQAEGLYTEIQDYQNRAKKMKDLKTHVAALHANSNHLFRKEFEELQTMTRHPQESSHPAIARSNRESDDHHGRSLITQDVDASFIPGLNSDREYIATKGPDYAAIPHFWKMVWEHKSQVIVMLSDRTENDTTMVQQYWPNNTEPSTFGEFKVEVIHFSRFDKSFIREYRITVGNLNRRVTHFFLPAWWDHEGNMSSKDIMGFLQVVREKMAVSNPGPLVVQCSAGLDKTGVFIALDHFMQHIDRHSLDDDIDVFEFLLGMRRIQSSLVQDETSYIFIFDTVVELVQRKMERGDLLDKADNTDTIHQQYQGVMKSPTVYDNLEPTAAGKNMMISQINIGM